MNRKLAASMVVTLGLAVGFAVQVYSDPITPDNVRTLTEEVRINVGFFPETLVFLSDTRIAVASRTRCVIWDLPTGGQGELLDVSEIGRVLDLSADRSALAVCTPSGAVSLWSTDPFEQRSVVCALRATPYPHAAFSPDGRVLAVTNRHNDVELWDLQSASQAANLTGHRTNLFDVAFSPDGLTLAVAGGVSGGATDDDSCIKVWDAATGALLSRLPTADIGDNHAIAFARTGARLISAGNFRVVVWDTASWARVYETGPSFACTYGMAVSSDEQLLALAMEAGRICVMELATMRTLRCLTGPGDGLDAAFSPAGTRLAASFADGTVIVWTAP